MADAVVLFDNVYVPFERVFVDGSVDQAKILVNALGTWERAVAVADRAREAELLLGLAQTMAEMNGVPDVGHIRTKMSQMAVFAAICRATWEAAVNHARPDEDGALRPNDLYVYAAKAYADDLHNEMVSYLHDVSGGSLLTCPSVADYENEATHLYLEKYLRTMAGVSGQDRMKVFHLIRDLTADTYWGWKKIAHQSIAGGVVAQQRAALEAFDLTAAKAEVVHEAGLGRS
jgi:4-hydroxybutyryl-CoA dehydratase/vinylacetyl-CoA-Delta-isomerase